MNTQVTQKLLATVRARFDAHPHRHPGLGWSDVQSVLSGSPGALPSLLAMEATGGAEERAAGGALFCDRRYGHVFLYHNGASSYYAARGFRGILTVGSPS